MFSKLQFVVYGAGTALLRKQATSGSYRTLSLFAQLTVHLLLTFETFAISRVAHHVRKDYFFRWYFVLFDTLYLAFVLQGKQGGAASRGLRRCREQHWPTKDVGDHL